MRFPDAAAGLLLALGAAAAPAQQAPRGAPGVLQAGATAPDCRSALHVGPVQCAGDPTRIEAERAAALERAVDAYLANFGKPPREAVRALLDPSDRNIELWAQEQRRTLAIAAFAAARLTAIQQGSAGPPPARPQAPSP